MRGALPILILSTLGCQRPTGIAMTVTGLREMPAVQTLQVTVQIGGGLSKNVADLRMADLTLDDPDTVRLGLGLDLQEDVQGPLRVMVEALPDQGTVVLGQGMNRVALADGRTDVTVPLGRCSQSGWCWQVPSTPARPIYALWGADKNDVFAAGAFGTLLHYDGSGWSAMALPAEAGETDLYALWGRSHSDVWAVGGNVRYNSASIDEYRGIVLHYGTRWDAPGSLPARPAPLLRGLWARSGDEAWAVGQGGTILHLDGGVWQQEASPATANLQAVWGAGNDVFAAGEGGTLLRRLDGNWVAESVPGKNNLFSLWGVGTGELWAAGDGGTLLSWNGSGWTATPVAGPDLPTFLSVAGGGAGGSRWAAGCTGYGTAAPKTALYHLMGGTWQPITPIPATAATGCFRIASIVDDRYVWLTNGFRVYDAEASTWPIDGSKGGYWDLSICAGVNTDARDRWCPDTGDAIIRYQLHPDLSVTASLFAVGSQGRFSSPGALAASGNDIWYYGVGILHCHSGNGAACAAGRK